MSNIDIITKKIAKIREQKEYMVITQMLPTQFEIIISKPGDENTTAEGSGYISYNIFDDSPEHLENVLEQLDQYL